MKRSETISLGEAFSALLQESPELHEHLLEHRATALLPQILGPLWRHIGSVQISDGVLRVQSHSAAVRQGILLSKNNLIKQVNTAVGAELIRELAVV